MNEETKKAAPAYTTYTAFTNLIKDLRENSTPSHITRSVVKGSNSGKSMMIASLKYLDLVDSEKKPTDVFSQLIDNEEEYSTNLNKLLRDKYTFLFDDSINIGNTTTEKVAEKFRDAGASGSTVSKCIAFFLGAAKEAGVKVSARVKTPPIQTTNKTRKRVNDPPPADDQKTKHNTPKDMERITVPLRDMEDGVICFPKELDTEKAKKAVKMAVFILNQFYGIED